MAMTVALTGASGVMGGATLKALLEDGGFRVRILMRKSKKNIDAFASMQGNPYVDIVWGDLRDAAAVKDLVNGCDRVLHIGGMVSPAADRYPQLTLQTNVVAVENIVSAMLSLGMENIPLAYIGSVAQTGNREIHNRFGRTGDPIAPARYDAYAMSKCKAELVMAMSPIKKWVSFRQSGILHSGLLTKANDPITFHVPINGFLEWATVEDSARLMLNFCKADLPQEFWRRFYNISSGQAYRLTNYEFEELILRSIGAPSPQKIFDTKWFALKNFHGQWYADADVLDRYLSFRQNVPLNEYFKAMSAKVPSYIKLARLCPAFVMKLFMRKVASDRQLGTLTWIKTADKGRIEAFWGSMQTYDAIPGWDTFPIASPQKNPQEADIKHLTLDHGYDETLSMEALTPAMLQQAAAFRGGRVVSGNLPSGIDLWDTPVEWECHDGHIFTMSARVVLLGGYWCPKCMENADDYPRQAKFNKFLAQVVAPLHNN